MMLPRALPPYCLLPSARNCCCVGSPKCLDIVLDRRRRRRRRRFNICMDEPVDYSAVAAHLAATRGLPYAKT